VPPLYPLDARVVAAADKQLSTSLGGEVVILSLERGVYYGLRDVGVYVWELLKTPRRVDELLGYILDQYHVTRETAEADLQALLSDLAAHELIEIDVSR
jgi:hypothetical protein